MLDGAQTVPAAILANTAYGSDLLRADPRCLLVEHPTATLHEPLRETMKAGGVTIGVTGRKLEHLLTGR